MCFDGIKKNRFSLSIKNTTWRLILKLKKKQFSDLGYGPDGLGFESRKGQKHFSFLLNVWTGRRIFLFSGCQRSFLVVKRSGRVVGYPLLHSVEVRNDCNLDGCFVLNMWNCYLLFEVSSRCTLISVFYRLAVDLSPVGVVFHVMYMDTQFQNEAG